jgi:hypothetical protein
MFKRLFWLTVGSALGFGGSLWVQRWVRQKVEQYYPDRVAKQVTTSVRSLVADAKASAGEGRDAMRAREASLKARYRPADR